MKNDGIVWKISTFVLAAALAICLFTGEARATQTHMRNALTALQTARTQLGLATRDKGGHRAAAVNYVNKAITEVELGIRTGAQ
ncbi:MAG: hypothetical protein RDV48_23215 [Candidatus Eremiobacteraeota bacterium]|nr:hypothetical protein [Candidatus Eremiobacteraeota bacterium]